MIPLIKVMYMEIDENVLLPLSSNYINYNATQYYIMLILNLNHYWEFINA